MRAFVGITQAFSPRDAGTAFAVLVVAGVLLLLGGWLWVLALTVPLLVGLGTGLATGRGHRQRQQALEEQIHGLQREAKDLRADLETARSMLKARRTAGALFEDALQRTRDRRNRKAEDDE